MIVLIFWEYLYDIYIDFFSLHFSLFDREQQDLYTFEVSATDGGLYGPRLVQHLVEVLILDENDNSPVFDKIPYTREIPQNTQSGTSVLTVSIISLFPQKQGQWMRAFLIKITIVSV